MRLSIFRLVLLDAIAAVTVLAPHPVLAQDPAPDPRIMVDARLALHALTSLSDGHLRKLADVLTLTAASDAARSGDWERVRVPLAEAAEVTVPAVHWFALPDGTYWTVERGRETANLSERAYFPRVLGGETVMGDLVVSRSTSRNTAIVAVPVRGDGGAVVGVLGASVHLDSLSALLREEVGGLEERHFFFAIDAQPLGAVHSDSALIFTDPTELGDAGMTAAFQEMLTREEGTVTYTFRGSPRTVVYRRSPDTGWWYGYGSVAR